MNPLRDAQLIMNLLAAFGEDPLALWGDPQAQRDVWRAHDPTELAPRLRGTPLFISVGNGQPGPLDPPREPDALEAQLHAENVAPAQRLRALRIPAVLDFYGPGTHTWPYWERELRRSLPLLLRAL